MIVGHEPEDQCLYSMDDPVVFFPRAWAETASKARYQGWKQLEAVGMVDCRFDPRDVIVRRRFTYRYDGDVFGEMTHRLTDDPYVPGAYAVWVVEVLRC